MLIVLTFLRILVATIPHQAGGIEDDVLGVVKLNPINAIITRGDTVGSKKTIVNFLVKFCYIRLTICMDSTLR